eukprot:COSAG02_NODE_482_length_21409_cov_126.131018_20_plen_114_part_00
MYTNPFKEESFLRLFFMSNDIQVVPYDSECERRFKCYDLDNRYKGVANEQTKAHFRPIYAIPNEVYALGRDHSGIFGRPPPRGGVAPRHVAPRHGGLLRTPSTSRGRLPPAVT